MKKIDFSKYSSIKIGPICEVAILNDIKETNESFYIIGGANNLLISNTPPKLAKLSKKFDYIKEDNDFLYVGASTPSGKVVAYCRKNDIKGFELLQKLPGQIGGIVKMNAGLKEYEIFDNLVAIKTIDGYIKKENIKHSYRYTEINHIIYEAIFKKKEGFDNKLYKWFESLRESQPKEPSAGSCFKNPKGDFAARLLQECGLKGYRIGDIGFSQKHANFLVNYAKGTYEDAITLIELAKKRVFEKFGVFLELEIKILSI